MLPENPNDWRYRLEYHEKQKAFHHELLNKVSVHPANTHGWVTISESEPNFTITLFSNYIDSLYPDIAFGSGVDKEKQNAPTINDVIQEWERFNQIITLLLERYSNSSYWVMDFMEDFKIKK